MSSILKFYESNEIYLKLCLREIMKTYVALGIKIFSIFFCLRIPPLQIRVWFFRDRAPLRVF